MTVQLNEDESLIKLLHDDQYYVSSAFSCNIITKGVSFNCFIHINLLLIHKSLSGFFLLCTLQFSQQKKTSYEVFESWASRLMISSTCSLVKFLIPAAHTCPPPL